MFCQVESNRQIEFQVLNPIPCASQQTSPCRSTFTVTGASNSATVTQPDIIACKVPLPAAADSSFPLNTNLLCPHATNKQTLSSTVPFLPRLRSAACAELRSCNITQSYIDVIDAVLIPPAGAVAQPLGSDVGGISVVFPPGASVADQV